MRGISGHSALSGTMQGDEMLQPEEVAAMVRLHGLGWGAKRLSKEFGCPRNTVRRYLRAGGPVGYRKPERRIAFDGLEDWLRERFFRHGGNADVIRQELASEHGIVIGLRSVELRVRQWRRELKAQKRATVRFETEPGRQLQIDFGDTRGGLAMSGCGCICSWRRWVIHSGCISAPCCARGRRTGLPGWKAPSCGLAGCRRRFYWIIPGRWSSIMTR